jgi:hypothetical protein
VLELILPRYPDPQVVADVAAAAHALSYVVVANRRHTDLFEWGQRTTPFSLAAEIQRRLLPGSFTLVFRSFLALSLVRGTWGHAGDAWFVDLGR